MLRVVRMPLDVAAQPSRLKIWNLSSTRLADGGGEQELGMQAVFRVWKSERLFLKYLWTALTAE
jgi:hypothetical protein